jgi:hypothetical protein
MKKLWLGTCFFLKLIWEYMPIILAVLFGILVILQIWAAYHSPLLKLELMDDALSP